MKLTPDDVSVAARMQAFQDGIEKMLWIQLRGTLIWKTTKTSTINVPLAYLPDLLQNAARRHPELVDAKTQSLMLGPIPEGSRNLRSTTSAP
jgi:hypothetical protein